MRPSVLAVCASIAFALGSATSAATQGNRCATPQNRQFDFWLGSWRVADASGKLQGTNTVTSEFAGCVVQEHWAGTGGSRGSSFNTYLPGTHQWQQTWVDSNGLTLHLLGRLEGNMMVLSGTRVTAERKTITDRISWTPLTDGRVRQHWQQRAGTGVWQEIFDGYYSHQ
jgi:hypothetical protein